jgi:hypothetical protein
MRTVNLSGIRTSAALVLSCVLLLAAPPARAGRADRPGSTATPDFQSSWTLASGKSIEIKGVNGNIDATLASGNTVEVTAVKRARRSDPDEVKIEVIEHEGGVTVCAKYPDAGGDRNTCEPGGGGSSHTHNNDVEVHFTVRVPAGIRFVGRTVNGGIIADGLRGPIKAESVNGSIHFSTTGYGTATTVNGSIDASLGTGTWPEPLEFTTVNGEITLSLPADIGAELRASSVNGEIESAFPLTVRGKIGRHRVSGTIGKGGSPLKLETVNGDITLKSSS